MLWKAETFPFPRALVEPLGITLIFCIGLFPLFSNESNFVSRNCSLATITVTSLKLTPPLQGYLEGITDLRSGLPDVEEAYKLLELEDKRNKCLKDKKITNDLKTLNPKNNIILKCKLLIPQYRNPSPRKINLKYQLVQK